MPRYWQHLEQRHRRVAQSVTVTCLKIWWQASARSETMKQLNVATSHLLKDVQNTWPLPRHRRSTSWSLQHFSKNDKMSLTRVSEMLILMSGWKMLMRTMATKMNGMRTSHKMMPTWRNPWISGNSRSICHDGNPKCTF